MFRAYFSIVMILMQFSVPLSDDVTEEVPHDAYFKVEWEKHEFPNPLSDDGSWACGNREKKYYFCDPARKLHEAEAFAISSLINRWLSIARCPCLNCNLKGPYYVIMVAVVPKIKEYPDLTTLDATLQFAEYLTAETWNFAVCDDSILILLSVDDKSLWTAVGKKVKEMLTSSCLGDIFEENRHLLAAGLFGKAIENLVAEYISVLKEDRDCSFQWPSWWKYPAILLVTVVIILFFGDQVSSYVFNRRLFTCVHEVLINRRMPQRRIAIGVQNEQEIQNQSNTSVHSIFSLSNPPLVTDITPVIEDVLVEEEVQEPEQKVEQEAEHEVEQELEQESDQESEQELEQELEKELEQESKQQTDKDDDQEIEQEQFQEEEDISTTSSEDKEEEYLSEVELGFEIRPRTVRDHSRIIVFTVDGQTGYIKPDSSELSSPELDTSGLSHISVSPQSRS